MIKAAGILFYRSKKHKLLLLRRTKDKLWGFPGGQLEKDESSINAAIRETFEETKIKVDDPSKLEPLVETSHYEGDTRTYMTYLYQTDVKLRPELNDEHSEARWFKFWELPDDIHPGVSAAVTALLLKL